MFFGISENLKSESTIFVVILSAFLRHGGHSDGANAHIFAKTSDPKKDTHRNDQAPNPINIGFGDENANKIVP